MPKLDSYLVALASAWIAYFAFHSVLASLRLKHWFASRWPNVISGYRIAYNLLAIVLFLPPAWFTLGYSGPDLVSWRPPWSWAADALAVTAVIGVLWSMRWYDGQEFLGLRQWRERRDEVLDMERFHLSPLHRFVRHPWYFLALVILWTRDLDAARLLSVVLFTAYFWVGSALEERKLLRYHGEVYRRYRERVPALFPLPWRYLSTAEANALTRRAEDA